MSVAKDRWEKREAFAALMEKGEFQGYITNDDIVIVFPEAEDSEERLERLQMFFRSAGKDRYRLQGQRHRGGSCENRSL